MEVAKGDEASNVKYCTKEETRVAGPWVFGERAQAGKRNDLARVREMLEEKKGMREIVQEASSYQSMRSAFIAAASSGALPLLLCLLSFFPLLFLLFFLRAGQRSSS